MPRHLFVPDASIEAAYAQDGIVAHPGADGRPRSLASAPTIVAQMLEQLDVQPGHRILEIGAGTGYNAALLHPYTPGKEQDFMHNKVLVIDGHTVVTGSYKLLRTRRNQRREHPHPHPHQPRPRDRL